MTNELKQVLKKIEDRHADLAKKPWCAYRKSMNGGAGAIDYILDMIRSRGNPDYERKFPPSAEFDTEQEAMEYAMINNMKDGRFPFVVAKQEIGMPRKIQ